MTLDGHACRKTSKPFLKLKGKVNLKQQINSHLERILPLLALIPRVTRPLNTLKDP